MKSKNFPPAGDSSAFRNRETISALLTRIGSRAKSLPPPLKIMEVCGTHTMTIHKFGLKNMLAEAGVEMISGPGCPVCITPNEIHEAAISLVAEKENLILATFGDMTRVPTKKGSLQTAIPAPGSGVKIVYSPEESLSLAGQNPEKEVVFFGVGFETTIPAIALTAKKAAMEKLVNYSVLSALWLIPPPLRAMVEAGRLEVSGFLYPGHVSVIIGREPYRFLAEEFGIPGAIAGFEPADILLGILSVLDQIEKGQPVVSIEYSRAVTAEGNPVARSIMKENLDVKDAHWRGLGMIPASGLKLKKSYSRWDAEAKYRLDIRPKSGDLPGCRCGDVLRGLISPPRCPLYSAGCTPESPHGPCMVSFEGACLVHYKYSK